MYIQLHFCSCTGPEPSSPDTCRKARTEMPRPIWFALHQVLPSSWGKPNGFLIWESRGWCLEPGALRKLLLLLGQSPFPLLQQPQQPWPVAGLSLSCRRCTTVLGLFGVIYGILFLQQPSWRCEIAPEPSSPAHNAAPAPRARQGEL